MTLADAGASRIVRAELHVEAVDNTPPPNRLVVAFLEVGELPDYEEDNWLDMEFPAFSGQLTGGVGGPPRTHLDWFRRCGCADA